LSDWNREKFSLGYGIDQEREMFSRKIARNCKNKHCILAEFLEKNYDRMQTDCTGIFY
jgi:hypothetical protein